MQLCFATNNFNKLQEVQGLLGSDFQLVTLKEIGCEEELPEERDTFEGNSLQKAEYIFTNYHFPCFADDSGLEVEALQGSPGVFSARYAGPQRSHDDNMDLLLKNMKGQTNRNARFKTIITLVALNRVDQFEGMVNGTIGTEKRGGGGFGYDPLFFPYGHSRTFAEMSLSEKNKISHRALAIGKLVVHLKNLARTIASL